MGIFSRLERGMENGLEGAADRMFDAPISPVQISKKAERAMKREKMVGAGRQYAPTLYTILVNPDDDQRLFGYYPTLAGETETYLAAKAAESGLSMDGTPLVRFIVDEELKHGKFDVIAEMVSAPIVAQLRQEEMARYGLAPQPVPQQRAQNNRGSVASAYAPAAAYPSTAGAVRPQSYPQTYPQTHAQNAHATASNSTAAPATPAASATPVTIPNAAGMASAGIAEQNAAPEAAASASVPASQAPQVKPPLPYVPEEEIDRSIDYGEYTFNSQDFESYEQSAQAIPPVEQPIAQPSTPPAGGSFAAGVSAPAAAITVARLIDNATLRAWTLHSSRMIVGRSSASDIVIDDINASRSHAELRCDTQGQWLITDLGSTNGTFVNGQRITTRPLMEGDRIAIGTTDLMFSLH